MSKTTSTVNAIRSQISDLLAGRAKTDEQLAELRKEAAWAEGEEHRARCVVLGERAAQLADSTADTRSEIAAALVAVTEAVRRVHELANRYNTGLADLAAELKKEGIPRHSADHRVPPAPTHAGVAPTDHRSVRIEYRNILPVRIEEVIDRAIKGATNPDLATPNLQLTRDVIPQDGPFWRSKSTSRVFPSTTCPNSDCIPATWAEFLSGEWQLDLASLPDAVIKTLTSREKARLAEQFLPEDAA